ncbi:MAG: hypothetical protein R2861_15895 [Desulfobacterales bacterium]
MTQGTSDAHDFAFFHGVKVGGDFSGFKTVNLMNPFSAGEEAMPMGISPRPGMDSSANWPDE